MNDFLKYNTNLIRDTVHTTDSGAEEYSRIIFDLFQKDKHTIGYPINVIKTKYCDDVKVLNVNKIFKDNIIFEGDCYIIAFF